MKTEKNTWTEIVKTPDSVFSALCKLTLQVCEREEFPVSTFTATGNRWKELAAAWDALIEGGALGIFLDVVHRTMWGFPYNWANPNCEEITRIVHYELLRDREAFNAWDTCNAFEEALHVPVNEQTPWLDDYPTYHCSIDHYEYLVTRMLYKLRFSKRRYTGERKACEAAWGEYIRCIGRIVPASKSWNEAQWANENNIHNEIQRLYGVDYRSDLDSYHQMYSMLTLLETHPLRKIFAEAWYSHKIKVLPMALAKVLWPNETVTYIMNMFMVAAHGSEETSKNPHHTQADPEEMLVFEYKDLLNSWLYRTVDEWRRNAKETDDFPKNVKRLLFQVAMRVK